MQEPSENFFESVREDDACETDVITVTIKNFLRSCLLSCKICKFSNNIFFTVANFEFCILK